MRAVINPPATIRNWTVDKGFLNGDFVVSGVTDSAVEIVEPAMKIRKVDFQTVFDLWPEYHAGVYPRSKIRDQIRTSKYVISIIHTYPPA